MESQRFIHIEKQSDFPASDLTETNATVLPHVLEFAGIESQARHLQEYQRPLYEMAHYALWRSGFANVNSPEEYSSFTQGFATFEAMSMIVQQRLYDGELAVNRTNMMYVLDADFADVELAERIGKWPDERPNTYGAVVQTGINSQETVNQIRARTIGAQIAFELQRPILDAA